MTTLYLLQVLALVVRTTRGHILPMTDRSNLAWSRCHSMGSSSRLVLYTSPSIKDLFVATAEVDNSQWEGTYVKDTGGIITVCHELGEPIHKANNRALRLWKEYDDTMSKLPCE